MEQRVGIVGLGNMGGGIARNYLKKGMPLAVWDISLATRRPFEGLPGVDVATPDETLQPAAGKSPPRRWLARVFLSLGNR